LLSTIFLFRFWRFLLALAKQPLQHNLIYNKEITIFSVDRPKKWASLGELIGMLSLTDRFVISALLSIPRLNQFI
jgi:hypothetical protein